MISVLLRISSTVGLVSACLAATTVPAQQARAITEPQPRGLAVSANGPASSAATTSQPRARAKNRCAWNGQWRYYSRGSVGMMNLRTVGRHARHLQGEYWAQGKNGRTTQGKIWGKLNSPCGWKWTGRYEDSSGNFFEGPHLTTLRDNRRSFTGKFWTCDSYWPVSIACRYSWNGVKVYAPPL